MSARVNPSSRQGCWHCPSCLGVTLKGVLSFGTQEDVYSDQTELEGEELEGARMDGKRRGRSTEGAAGCGNKAALGVQKYNNNKKRKTGRKLSIFRCAKHKMERHYSITSSSSLQSIRFLHSSLARATDTQERPVCPEYQ